MSKRDDEHEEADETTTVILEAALLDYSPALTIKNPFTAKDSRVWPWSRRDHEEAAIKRVGERRQAGVVQLLKKTPVSSTPSAHDEPTFWLRFRDMSVRNARDLPLYVVLSTVSATSLDTNGKLDAKAVGALETRSETVLLDVGPEGQWRQAVLPREFEQQLALFDPLAFSSVAILKPSAARPLSIQPVPFAYGVFEPYSPPPKSPEQLALESEALAAALLTMDNDPEDVQGGQRASGDTDSKSKSDALDLDVLQRNARRMFRLFDTDRSNSIDFDEYKRMLAYSKTNLLESKARRFFQLVDSQNKGYIDEREFVVALYIANYLRLHGESSSGDKRSTPALSPSDVFHQLDGDRDEMLNVFEYERAVELLGVPRSTAKQGASVRTLFPASSLMTLEQFKRAWVDQIDVRHELSKRSINYHHVPQEVAASLSLRHILCKGRRETERLKQLLLDSIDEQERREVELALKAKAEVVKMDRRRREEEQEAARSLFKQHKQTATETRTNEAIRERQSKIRRRKERVIKDRQAKEERKLLQKMAREAERRSQLEMQVARELVAAKAETLTLHKAKSGADAVDLRSRGLKELPETLMRGRDALAALSSLMLLDLGQNKLVSLPGAVFTHLFVLKSLDVSENLLETLPIEIGQATDLVTLNLRSNRISELPAAGIRKLANLKVLDLAFNLLARFGDECDANGLPVLEELDLSCNAPFQTLTDSIRSLTSLKRLTLKGNAKLTRLPTSIEHLQALVVLDCSSCGQLRRIGRGVFGPSLRSLRRVDLSFNALVSLPESIGQLQQLQDLQVRESALVTLPSTFGDLSSLVALNCEHNQLEKLPRAAFSEKMKAMETLELSRNKLHTLPETIGLVTTLRSLKVSNNRLTSVPLELGALVNLATLDLSWNALTHLPEELGCLAALEHCDLSHNQLEHLPVSIVLWTKLRLLSCSDNRLSSPLTPALRSLRALEYLDLSRNALRALDACVYELESLEVLSLASNKLTLLPREMASGNHCLRLRKLDLYRNKLSALPLEFADRLLDQLQVLVIDGNPLTRLPDKWSAKWGPREQFSTGFSGGYTSAEAKDWTRDCAEWYPFIVETWRELTLTRQQESGYCSDAVSSMEESVSTCEDVDQLLRSVSGDDFVCRVRAKMGEDIWKERYQRLVLHYYYEFRHVGHAVTFHQRVNDSEQQIDRQEAVVEQQVLELRNARAEEAIRESNAFRARVDAAYRIEDASELARKAMDKRRQHEHRMIASARQEATALKEQVNTKLPIAKQREAERRRREHAAILQSLHELTRERKDSQTKRAAYGRARYKYGRVAAANEDDGVTEESLRE